MDSRRSSASHRHWRLNWWDIWPLVDGERRPMQWVSDSLILSPHPASPTVVGRIFPSGRSFILPPPNPILNNPTHYSPPSVIATAADNRFVFAFFPGNVSDAIACIWNRNDALDSWNIETHWDLISGQDIIAACWVDFSRHWTPDGLETRRPPLGPVQSFAHPILLLVSRNNIVHLITRYSRSFGFKMFSAPLRHPTVSNTPEIGNPTTVINSVGGLRICTKAVFGLTYNESSIIIATNTAILPPTTQDGPHFSEFGGIPTSPLGSIASSWENFGQEQVIELCEVKITFHGCQMELSTSPFSPIFPAMTPLSHLTDMIFVPHLPLAEPISEEHSTDHPQPSEVKAALYLLLTYLDVEGYSSPKSHILCFEITRNSSPVDEKEFRAEWIHRPLNTSLYTNFIVSFILPAKLSARPAAAMVGLLDFTGTLSKHSEGENVEAVREAKVGKIVRVTLPNLQEDEAWAPSVLMTAMEDAGCHPPISVAISPNELYICTAPSLWNHSEKLGLHSLPRPKCPDTFPLMDISKHFVAALFSDRTTCDLVHMLTNPSVELSTIMDLLSSISELLGENPPVRRDWDIRLTRLAVEVFTTRSKRVSRMSSDSKEIVQLDKRVRTGMGICSLHALRSAFDICKDDEGYELEPIWHLIAFSTWLVDFCENLIRDLVIWDSQQGLALSASSSARQTQDPRVKNEIVDVDSMDLNAGQNDPNEVSSLIHIVHPYALGTLKASRVRSEIAKEILVDVVDGSGINFVELETQLKKVQELAELKAVDRGLHQRYLCTLSPFVLPHDLLVKACQLVILPSCISKARLFIKPADLIDGISRLNLTAAKTKQERDIISKMVLGLPRNVRLCLRCGGKTDLGQVPLPRGTELRKLNLIYSANHWLTWQHRWARCVCGGEWVVTIMP